MVIAMPAYVSLPNFWLSGKLSAGLHLEQQDVQSHLIPLCVVWMSHSEGNRLCCMALSTEGYDQVHTLLCDACIGKHQSGWVTGRNGTWFYAFTSWIWIEYFIVTNYHTHRQRATWLACQSCCQYHPTNLVVFPNTSPYFFTSPTYNDHTMVTIVPKQPNIKIRSQGWWHPRSILWSYPHINLPWFERVLLAYWKCERHRFESKLLQ